MMDKIIRLDRTETANVVWISFWDNKNDAVVLWDDIYTLENYINGKYKLHLIHSIKKKFGLDKEKIYDANY